MDSIDFEMLLWFSSVQLVRLNERNAPTGIASGALIDYGGQRVLLTVAHATGDQKKWAILLRYVPGRGAENYSVGAMNFLARASLSKPKRKLEDVDFAYVQVPPSLRAYRQEIEPVTLAIKGEIPITVHVSSLTDLPSAEQKYGFCGMVLPAMENHFGKSYFSGEVRIYSGLTYLRTDGDYHYFSLPFKHPGHEHFEGCSGAPILSDKGELVALVCGGDIDQNEVYGVSLKAYKTPVDILVGNVR